MVFAHADIERQAAAHFFGKVGSDVDVGVGAYLLRVVSADGLVEVGADFDDLLGAVSLVDFVVDLLVELFLDV